MEGRPIEDVIADQKQTNQICSNLLLEITMRKTTKKAERWITKKQGKKIVAKRLEPGTIRTIYTGPSSVEFSSAASLGAGSGMDASPTWTGRPQEPGLHLMRFATDGTFGYHAVRAVLVNDGLSECYQIKYANTPSGDLNTSEWTSPEFQKVSE